MKFIHKLKQRQKFSVIVLRIFIHNPIQISVRYVPDSPECYRGISLFQDICPVCTGQPGVLPVLNKHAVELIVRTGLALDCTINKKSVFARKQYFYPDLPKNYQISQYELPFCEHGKINITVDGKTKSIGITRIHLEEDAGKLIHDIGSRQLDYSLADYNRTGVPLMEIVSEPDMRSFRL